MTGWRHLAWVSSDSRRFQALAFHQKLVLRIPYPVRSSLENFQKVGKIPPFERETELSCESHFVLSDCFAFLTVSDSLDFHKLADFRVLCERFAN